MKIIEMVRDIEDGLSKGLRPSEQVIRESCKAMRAMLHDLETSENLLVHDGMKDQSFHLNHPSLQMEIEL